MCFILDKAIYIYILVETFILSFYRFITYVKVRKEKNKSKDILTEYKQYTVMS